MEVPQPSVAVPLNPYWTEWCERARARAADGYLEMIDELRALQDHVAASAPPAATVRAVCELLGQARSLVAGFEVDDADQIFGRLLHVPGRGQTLLPALHISGYCDAEQAELAGWTTFGRFHGGSNGVVHGGAIAMLFDELFGRLADGGDRTPSRTASLRIDYRSATPIGRPLSLQATLVEVAGRKRRLRATLQDGDTLCAEATALFVGLRPPRPTTEQATRPTTQADRPG
jgi:acyl-coenzyme A thioesterase PaaI-like protein